MIGDWMNERVRRMKWQDIALLKICVFSLALLLAKTWSWILDLDWWWYGIIFLVTYLYLILEIYILRK